MNKENTSKIIKNNEITNRQGVPKLKSCFLVQTRKKNTFILMYSLKLSRNNPNSYNQSSTEKIFSKESIENISLRGICTYINKIFSSCIKMWRNCNMLDACP